MRRIIDVLQTYTFATKSEAMVLLWLACLVMTGTLGAALFPESDQHLHISSEALVAFLDSSDAASPSADTSEAATQNSSNAKLSVKPGAMININKASLRDLESIPGIGPAMAQRIAEQRRMRRFTSIEDLLDVKGIGKKKLEKMRPYIIAP